MDRATKSWSNRGSTQDALSLKQAADNPAHETNNITNRPTSHVFIRQVHKDYAEWNYLTVLA